MVFKFVKGDFARLLANKQRRNYNRRDRRDRKAGSISTEGNEGNKDLENVFTLIPRIRANWR
jgi:hypothetical protein